MKKVDILSFKDKLNHLRSKRLEAEKLNRAEVVEEDRMNKQPANWEKRQERTQWKLDDERKKKECEARGGDYKREKMLNVSAADAERVHAAKQFKKNTNHGFSTFDEAGERHYQKLVKKIKTDEGYRERYQQKRAQMGDELFYAGLNTPLAGQVQDSPEDIQRMVDDLNDRKSKKKEFSRRRQHNDNKDVDYINDRNAKHNEKLERYYGKYTQEIKQNLERGTAV